jgi:hypothetical protein
VCYVYLEDVATMPRLPNHPDSPDMDSMHTFHESRWFRRGWTLQELLAPNNLQFFNKSGTFIGNRSELRDSISKITCIPPEFLMGCNLATASIAQRMAWAAERVTSRQEDMAYCLLGIFDVNMPLLYGEGGPKAFCRLQEMIVRQTDDQSIFAWGFGLPDRDYDTSILARSPSDFAGCKDVVPCRIWKPMQVTHFEITKKGLRIELPFITLVMDQKTARGTTHYGLLNCRLTNDFTNLVAIPLHSKFSRDGTDLVIERMSRRAPYLCNEKYLRLAKLQAVYITAAVSGTTISTSNSFLSSALVQRSQELQDLRYEQLYVDTSLRSIMGRDHIHVHESDTPDQWPTPPMRRRAYFGFWMEISPTSSSRRHDFLMKLEFSPKDSLARFFSKLMGKDFTNYKVRCFIAKAQGLTPEGQQTPEAFETLEWSQGITNGHLQIRAHVRERTILGSPMSVVTLRTPQEQVLYYCLSFLSIILSPFISLFNRASVAVKHGPPIELIIRVLKFYTYTSAGLACLTIAVFLFYFMAYLPLSPIRLILCMVLSSFWLALGIVSFSTYFFQSSQRHDGYHFLRHQLLFALIIMSLSCTVFLIMDAARRRDLTWLGG